jgi:ferric-dicitrate binding protein FerR (iron transport regulator)
VLPPADVFVGETLQTAEKSRAQFKLGRDTILRMGAETRVRLDRMLVDKGGLVTVDGGPVLIDKTPGTGDRPVELKGDFGLIVVRGTRLFAGPSNGVIGVFVEHGEIQVTSGGRSVTLRDGQGVDIARRGAPPSAVKSWGAKRIEAALASVQ